MKKVKLFFTVLALSLAAVAFAQNKTVTGVVTDASNGEAIPFASIQVKGTATGASTDVNGKYSISVPQNATLIFSSIGYLPVEEAVAGKSSINASLPVDSEMLEGTVVVGYGSAKKVGSVVGSVSTVKSEIVKNAPSASVLDNLQGQVAGLTILSGSGVSGEDAVSTTIHGVGSLGSSSEPLFVVDGIPTSSRSVMALNPNDIVSISVMKDASSTSIYGSRAANGVIYITTKTGSYDTKATVSVRSQWGVNTIANKSYYENFMSGDEWIDFRLRTGTMSYDQIYNNYISKGLTANTKWYKHFMNTAASQSQNVVTIQGGGKKVAYLVSASQFHQEGTTIGNYFDRYTVRTNLQGHPLSWLKFGVNSALSVDKNQANANWSSAGAPTDGRYLSGGLSCLLNPLYPAVDENGNEYEIMFPNGIYNPKYDNQYLFDVYTRYGLNGNAFLEINPVKGLKITSRGGVDGYFKLNNYGYYPSWLQASGSGYRYRSTSVEYSATITNTIEYAFDIARNNHFTLLAGHEGVINKFDNYSAQSRMQDDDRLLNLQNGKNSGTDLTFKVSESYSESRLMSFFGHIDYNFAEKYFVDLTLRNDACSRFGANHKSATFWSAGAMWKLGSEDFMKNVSWIDDLNIKVNYGTQGNAEIGNYSALGLIGTGAKYNGVDSKMLGQPSNPDLTWEKQALFTAGFNARLFDRLDVDIAYYDRNTTSMLMDVPYAYTTGFDELTANVGSLKNSGVDIALGIDILRGKDYFLSFNTTFNYNASKVTELFDGLQRWEDASAGLAYVVGKPVAFYAPIYAGVDPEDGAPMWYVPGENVDETTKNETTKVYSEEALTQNTGLKLFAPFTGGFGIHGAWKGLSVNCDFSYVAGQALINNDAYFYANPNNNTSYNCNKIVTDYWTPNNRNAKYPDWTKGYMLEFDTHLYEDASFLRLKNLQVAYDFATLFKSNKFLKNLKLIFTGRNLLTFTNYTGTDPESTSNVVAGIVGNTKQFLGGIEITF